MTSIFRYQQREDEQSDLSTGFSAFSNIDQVFLVPSNSSRDLRIYLRHGKNLVAFHSTFSGGQQTSWKRLWSEPIFNYAENAFHPLRAYPWTVTNIFGDDVIVLRNEDGVGFFRQVVSKKGNDGPGLELISRDTKFRDGGGCWHKLTDGSDCAILFGKFYRNQRYFGVAIRDEKKAIQFYAAVRDRLAGRPLLALKHKSPMPVSWMSSDWSNFYLDDLTRTGQDHIIFRSETRLEIYRFDDNYSLMQVGHVPLPMDNGRFSERFFFANLTGQKDYRDILHLNQNGLSVYRYNSTSGDYSFVQLQTIFSKDNGWQTQYSDSFRLVDIDADEKDDLLFTGPKGIEALAFDPVKSTWKSLLDTSQWPSSQRFATVVGVVKDNPDPSNKNLRLLLMSTNDNEQTLNWGQLNWAIDSIHSPVKVEMARIVTNLTDTSNITSLIPKQLNMSDIIDDEKVILRWTEQWPALSMNETVVERTGQIKLSIPFFDSIASGSSFPVDVKLSLSYEIRRNQHPNLVGLGWSMNVPLNYIWVDFQGSIYEEDASYYLTEEGATHPLQPIHDAGQTRRLFKLTRQPDWTVEYHQVEQRWTIQTETETHFYGRHTREDGSRDDEAIRWNLSWNLRRGPGSHLNALNERLPVSWYLKARRVEATDRWLFYHYRIDTQSVPGVYSWTSSVRLLGLRDESNSKILFHYSRKRDGEFKFHDLTDSNGDVMFPVTLRDSHYIAGLVITIENYHQTFKFDYKVENGRRLLTAVNQLIGRTSESLFRFKYEHVDRHRNLVLSQVKLLDGTSTEFQYDVIPAVDWAIPESLISVSVFNKRRKWISKSNSILIDEQPLFDFGQHYTAVVYRRKEQPKRIYLKIIPTGSATVLLPLDDENVEKVPKFLKAHNDFCLVFSSLDDERLELCLFNYNRKSDKWFRPGCQTLSKDAQIQSSNESVFVADRSSFEGIKVFEPLESPASDRPLWRAYHLKLAENRDAGRGINRMKMGSRFLIAYDDVHLLICHRDLHGKWKLSVLKSLPGLSSNSDAILKELEMTDVGLDFLKVSDNFVILTSLEIINTWSGERRLSQKLHMFLIDSDYAIGRQQEILFRDPARTIAFNKESTGKEWIKFRIEMSPYGVEFRDGTAIRMNGQEWITVKKVLKNPCDVFSIPLGRHFILIPPDRSPVSCASKLDDYQLYAQDPKTRTKTGNPLHRIQIRITKDGQFINRYPHYLAYDNPANSVTVVTFLDATTLGPVRNFTDERLMASACNSEKIVTATKGRSEEYLVRSLSSIARDPHKIVVNRLTLIGSAQKLSVGYEREITMKHEEGVAIEKVSVIPGADKKLSGWREESWKFKVAETDDLIRSTKFFDASKQSVPLLEVIDDSIDDVTITIDQTVSYLGFESYEDPSNWIFNTTNVVRNGYALTGVSYLRLNAHEFIKGVFQFKINPTPNYVVTCWIRSDDPSLTTDSPTLSLKATLSTEESGDTLELLGQVKRRTGDWFYLEVMIDFDQVKENYTAVAIEIKGSETSTIDVDHVRFSPVGHNFQATVYDKRNRPTATIDTTGSISRRLYHQHREIAVINKRGQVERMLTWSSPSGRNKLNSSQPSIKDQPASRSVFHHPTSGSYETFDAYAFRSKRWIVHDIPESASQAWSVAPGRLRHRHQQLHRITANHDIFEEELSPVIRFRYLLSQNSSLTWRWPGADGAQYFQLVRAELDEVSLKFKVPAKPEQETIPNLPTNGEWILMLIESRRFCLWIDGVMLVDAVYSDAGETTGPWSSLSLEAQGNASIEDLLLVRNPRLDIEYLNDFGDKTQTVQLETSHTALVSQIIYDSLGRPAITTKLTRIPVGSASLMAYRDNFVTNVDPADPLSVWNSHRLEGLVDLLNPGDQGFAYWRTEYEVNPLNEEKTKGMPGRDFAINGPYSKKLSRRIGVGNVITNHFPPEQGFHYQVKETGKHRKVVAVFDQHNNRVGLYLLGNRNLMSTYEYDWKNRLVTILPPLYHERKVTWNRTDRLMRTSVDLEEALGTFIRYDNTTGQLVRKASPDSGTVQYYYDTQQWLAVYSSYANDKHSSASQKQINHVVYYVSDLDGHRMGNLNESAIQILRQHFINETLDNSIDIMQMSAYKDYQLIQRDRQSETNHERSVRITTYNEDYPPVMEAISWNDQGQMDGRTISFGRPDWVNVQLDVKKYYSDDGRSLLKSHVYPMTINGRSLRINFDYDKINRLINMEILSGTDSPKDNYIIKHNFRFDYHVDGQLAREHHLPGRRYNFTRTFDYNSPGFLLRLSDRFLTEEINYTDGGYGQDGWGDSSSIMRATFNATWTLDADWRWFLTTENELTSSTSLSSARLCLRALKRFGYLTPSGRSLKEYSPQKETSMPLVCGGDAGLQVARLLAEKRMPSLYGHSYAYSDHQNVVKAKYFTQETLLSKEMNLNVNQSLWRQLTQSGYVTMDGSKPKKSLLNVDKLRASIASANASLIYQKPIENLILKAIGYDRPISNDEFSTTFLQWKAVFDDSQEDNSIIETAQKIFQSLTLANQRKTSTKEDDFLFTSFLDGQLAEILVNYRPLESEILSVLARHLADGLGEHPFDLASYDVDANGNHHFLLSGFTRYSIAYDDDSNRIKHVQVEEPEQIGRQVTSMRHDGRGNVIQALHKGIDSIEYHPTSERVTAIRLADGRTLRFAYNFQGQRILKKVLDAYDWPAYEVHYVRDERGRILFDRRITCSFAGSSPLVTETAYIYGPRGLVGFVRNDKFHSVITDHAGSIRLVVKDGQVVAAYDYLPYGKLMRSFGNDPETQIVYRYAGQEWDVETGLYNYENRLYDPDIGRFYQPNLSEQFSSPYKYSGNPPVSLVDPDSEMAYNKKMFSDSRSCGFNFDESHPEFGLSPVNPAKPLLDPATNVRRKRFATKRKNDEPLPVVSATSKANSTYINNQDNWQLFTNVSEDDAKLDTETVASSASRLSSWMSWLTPVVRQTTSLVSLFPKLITKFMPSTKKFVNSSSINYYSSNTTDNRNVGITHDEKKVMCSFMSMKEAQHSLNDCRSVECDARMLTGRGETAHLSKPTATSFFVAFDSWLILACALPVIYRDIKALFKYSQTFWTTQRPASVAVSRRDTELWQKLILRLEKLMARQCHLVGDAVDVQWALPIYEELKQQVAWLCQRNSVAYLHVQLAETMTERLVALTEDIEEMLDEEGDVYYDCFHEQGERGGNLSLDRIQNGDPCALSRC